MGCSRRVTSAVLTLAIAGIAGIMIGDGIGRLLEDGAPAHVAAPAAPAPTLRTTTPRDAPTARPRARVLALDIDRAMRLDGETLDAAGLALALRDRADIVNVAPSAGVPWTDVVELVDRVRELGVRVSLAPPE